MVLINPEIIKCQFLNKTFYVNQTNGNNPVSLEKPLSTFQRPLCIDSSNLEVNLFIFVTEKCNLSCPFCFEEKKGSHQLDISPRYTLDELVSFLHRMCIEKATIWFFGGEPLLNFSWIISCVDRLKKEKIECSNNIATNLTMLNQNIVNYSKMWGVRYLINLDASLKIASGQKYADKVKENLTLIQENGLNVQGMSVWSPNCKVPIPDIIELYVAYGMRYFDLNIAHCFRYTKNDINAFTHELEEFSLWYISKILSHDLRYLWIQPFSKYIRSLLFPNEPLHINACGCGKQLVAISTDGSLYPCQFLAENSASSCGSVQSGIWNHTYKAVNSDTIPLCSKCDLKYNCKARCLANNVIMEGSPLSPEKSRCLLEHQVFACSAYIVGEIQKHPLELAVLRKAFNVGQGVEKSAH